MSEAIAEPPDRTSARYRALLALTALGVVYGDLGTSPLYALRECFHGPYAIAPTRANVLGLLSLIFWSLVLVVSVKYIVYVLRADNRGEGGILALTALVTPVGATRRGGRAVLILLGLFGTALVYGDGMITPAITVLSAVEGLRIATPLFSPYVIPIAIVILILLFVVQNHGTAKIGRIFGPVMLFWFLALAALGIAAAVREPSVFAAVDPRHAIDFFVRNRGHGFLVLGSVFLVLTGAEALYADLGHFGAAPIRLAWFVVALPALLLNYFGQGALLLSTPDAVENPFFRLAPAWALYPLVALATAAAVIASQALITGAYSLGMQAVQLGYAPRIEIDHTSAHEFGQIYVPSINWVLMAACIGLVLGFRSSTGLAAAYGIAVTTTMVITTLLFYVVTRERWGWSRARAVAIAGGFLVIDTAFLAANVPKIPHGGWFPLLVAAVVFTLMSTWQAGRALLGKRMRETILPLDDFLGNIALHPPQRVPGTAVFLYRNPNGTPPALLHNLKHNHVLHAQVVVLFVETAEVPHVDPAERVETTRLDEGFFRMIVRFGFMEDPVVPPVLAAVEVPGLDLAPLKTTFFLGRETLIPTERPGMALWREKLFTVMARNARSAASFFKLPPNRVIELGAQIEL
ncbi:MAG TPA: potassium transporter Kup [Longimicrobiaceae bacterium]|nr:potassium transporter Kup [Longimicrobiaceae bacterium]